MENITHSSVDSGSTSLRNSKIAFVHEIVLKLELHCVLFDQRAKQRWVLGPRSCIGVENAVYCPVPIVTRRDFLNDWELRKQKLL
jgi:hypothetical protein